MIDHSRLVTQFLQLVEINGSSGRERDVADYLKNKLNRLCIETTEDCAGDSFNGTAGNLVGRMKGTLPYLPAILLCAHMDTIQPTLGIKPVITNGTIATDQSTILGADDRAGVAIILEVIELLQKENIPHGPIEIIFTVGEEIGMRGAKYLQVSDLKAKMGFVFDSSAEPRSIVIEAPASILFEIRIIGKAAHAAVSPEKGINAIQIASQAIANLKMGRFGETGTVNVGIISGGKATNIVPDEVLVKGEVRCPNEIDLQKQMGVIEEQFRQHAQAAGASIKFTADRKYSGFSLDENSQVVQIAKKAISAAGYEPKPIKYPGGSDANILNENGIPTVNLGVGFNNVHSPMESIAIENLVALTKIGLNIIRQSQNYFGE
ncbi:MAG: M20/M25/M40 family metallo-hydrolase [Stygiobacter sp.]